MESRLSKPKQLALALGVFCVALLVAEIGVRWSTTPAFDSAKALERARSTAASMTLAQWTPKTRSDDGADRRDERAENGLKLQPYFGFDLASADEAHSKEVARFADPNSERTVDILFLGGSVAAEFANENFKQLERELEALPIWKERGARVYCRGTGGFRQPQQLHQLEYLLAIGYKPDIVVELDGFNEVALGLQNGREKVHPLMPPVSHWSEVTRDTPLSTRALDAIADVRQEQRASQRIFERAKSLGLFHSAITARITQQRLDRSRARYSTAAQDYEAELKRGDRRGFAVGPAFEATDETSVRLSSEIWCRSSIEMDAICRLWGIRYVHLLQPTLWDEGSKPTTESERKNGALPRPWALGARMGYPLLRARGADLAARGVEFHDLSQAFADVPEELYYDVCHFGRAGQQILLSRVVPILASKPPEPFTPRAK